MKRKFVTNLALLLFLNFLIKPFYAFGIDRTVQNTVGTGQYGLFFSLFSFTVVFQILLDLGIENFNRREIARHHDLVGKYLSNIIPLKFILGVAYFLISSTIGYLLGWRAEMFRMLALLLFNQFLANFILYFRSNLGGLHLFKVDSIISVLDRSFVIIICSVLLWGNITKKPFRIQWFIYAQTVSYLISAVIAFFILKKRAGKIRLSFDRQYYLSLLKRSLPYALLILLMASYLRMDSILLERILPDGEEQAGIYAHSFRILEILSNYGYLFSILLLPIFSKMLQLKQSVEELVKLSYLLIVVPTLLISISCIFYRQDIITLLYSEQIIESSKVFGILILSLIGICTTYIFGTLLTANGNLKELNIMAGIGVVINISLNLILIPRYQVMGSAVANLTTQLYAAIVQIVLAKKKFHFNVNFKIINKLVFYILFIVVVGFIVTKFINNWYLGFFILLTFGGLLSIIIRLISLKSLYHIIRYEEDV